MKCFMVAFLTVINVLPSRPAELDVIDCGVDFDTEVKTGDVSIETYPWVGVLYYTFHGDYDETRSTTTVALIQAEFVVGVAADIEPMPKHDFRRNSRVLLGVGWNRNSRRVRNYITHPQYGETLNTLVLVQLKDPINRGFPIKPLCPPPERLVNPEFYVVRFDSDYTNLHKKVEKVSHVPAALCKEFYIKANLYSKKMRPPYVACAVSMEDDELCVWNAGAALVSRDVWGRWTLLGLGVRGPGCGAPSRYLDMMSYYPWIKDSLAKFQHITISKINNQKYVLRTSDNAVTSTIAENHVAARFGNCDEEEKVNLIYREFIVLRTDNPTYQYLTYNLTIYQNVEYSCLTLELINASAVSHMVIRHNCPRNFGAPCYRYRASSLDMTVHITFSDKCIFEMVAWGWPKNMTLIDMQEWRWEEGTYYEDFSMTPVEYKGPTYQTLFGFEPLDDKQWVPEYDFWTTTEEQIIVKSTTALGGFANEEEAAAQTGFFYDASIAQTVPPPLNTTLKPDPIGMMDSVQFPKDDRGYETELTNWEKHPTYRP